MHIGWPNVDGIRGPGPVRCQINLFRSDDDPPVRKASRAEFPVMSDESSQAGTSAVVSAEKYDAPQVLHMRSASFS